MCDKSVEPTARDLKSAAKIMDLASQYKELSNNEKIYYLLSQRPTYMFVRSGDGFKAYLVLSMAMVLADRNFVRNYNTDSNIGGNITSMLRVDSDRESYPGHNQESSRFYAAFASYMRQRIDG